MWSGLSAGCTKSELELGGRVSHLHGCRCGLREPWALTGVLSRRVGAAPSCLRKRHVAAGARGCWGQECGGLLVATAVAGCRGLELGQWPPRRGKGRGPPDWSWSGEEVMRVVSLVSERWTW